MTFWLLFLRFTVEHDFKKSSEGTRIGTKNQVRILSIFVILKQQNANLLFSQYFTNRSFYELAKVLQII